VWTLSTRTKNNSKCRPIKFMQATDSSSSELTDLDSSDDEHTHDMNLSLCPPFVVETPTKRGREISEEDNNRSGKRTKMEEIIRSLSSQPCSPLAMPDPLGSEDVFEENEDHDPLPKFRAPRQTLFVHGWKPLSAMDDVARQRQREGDEEEEEMGVILPACSFNSSTSVPTSSRPTSTSIPPDYPMNDPSSSTLNRATSSAVAIPPPFTPSLQVTPQFLFTCEVADRSKGKNANDLSINPNVHLTFIKVERETTRIRVYTLYYHSYSHCCYYLFSKSQEFCLRFYSQFFETYETAHKTSSSCTTTYRT